MPKHLQQPQKVVNQNQKLKSQKKAEMTITKNLPPKTAVEKLLDCIIKHPYIVIASLCLISSLFAYGENLSSKIFVLPAILLSVIGFFSSYFIVKNDKSLKSFRSDIFALLFIISIIVSNIISYFVFTADKFAFALLTTGFVVCFFVLAYLSLSDLLNNKNFILILFAMGFLLRLAYVIYTDVRTRQHDVGVFDGETGHAGYIMYFYKNHALPDFDVRERWQYYHPPLHHILEAIWLTIQIKLFGFNPNNAYENVQILSLFYSSICMILSYKIFKHLGLKSNSMVVACAIVAFCPTFIILAGSFNNDILSITFALGAILNTICWYKKHTLTRIIAIALCVGLGMMTKLSVWMVAPAIGFVFIFVFFKEIKKFEKFIFQYLIFIIICAPLGLWWSIRNLVKFDVPLTYVPNLGTESDQYIGNLSFVYRVFHFDWSQVADVGQQFTRFDGKYNEFNPLISLIKTSLFDELIISRYYPAISGFNAVLFWSAVLVASIGFVCMVINFIKRKDNTLDISQKIFVLLIFSVMIISYFSFCKEFPFVCTQNIRYATPLIVVGAYFVGLSVQYLNKNTKTTEIFKNSIYTITTVYCISAFLVYDIVAFNP